MGKFPAFGYCYMSTALKCENLCIGGFLFVDSDMKSRVFFMP